MTRLGGASVAGRVGVALAALLVASPSHASNMAFAMPLEVGGAGQVRMILAVPLVYAPTTAELLCQDIGGSSKVASVARWDDASSQFVTHPCGTVDHHDTHFAWCGQSEPLACYSSPPDYERCVMYENKSDPAWYVLILNDINRFCCSNLFGPAAAAHCGESACAGDEGIRNHADPE